MKLSIVDFCSQYTSMLCYYYPVMCGAFATLVVFGLFLFFLSFIVNTEKEYGLAHDHSNIKSRFDLTVGSIDHWCLGGGNEGCPCEDPLQPLSRVERASWVQAVKANRKLVRGLVDKPVDVAFLGESVSTYYSVVQHQRRPSAELLLLHVIVLSSLTGVRCFFYYSRTNGR